MVWNVRFNAAVTKGTLSQGVLRVAGETRLRVVCRMVSPPANNYRSFGVLQLLRYDPSGYFNQLLVQEWHELTRDGIYIPLSQEANNLRLWLYERKYVASGYQILVATESY